MNKLIPIFIKLILLFSILIWSRTDSHAQNLNDEIEKNHTLLLENSKKELENKLNIKSRYSYITQFNTPIIVPNSSIDYSMMVIKPDSNSFFYMPIIRPDKDFEFHISKMLPDSTILGLTDKYLEFKIYQAISDSDIVDLSTLRIVEQDSLEVIFEREQQKQ